MEREREWASAEALQDLECETEMLRLNRDTNEQHAETLAKLRDALMAKLGNLAVTGGTEEERRRLIEEHERHVSQADDISQAELAKQQNDLKRRLKARKDAQEARKKESIVLQLECMKEVEETNKKMDSLLETHEEQLASDGINAQLALTEQANKIAFERDEANIKLNKERMKINEKIQRDTSLSQREKERILEEWEDQHRLISEQQDEEALQQQMKLTEKLNARRQKLLKKQQEQMRQQELLQEQAIEANNKREAQLKLLAEEAANAARSAANSKREAAAHKHREQLSQTAKRHEEEMKMLQLQIQEEIQRTHNMFIEEEKAASEAALLNERQEKERLQEEMERKIEQAKTDDERQHLVKNYQILLQNLENSVEEDKQKQKASLQLKLQARKKKQLQKQQQLMLRQERQLEEEKARQHQLESETASKAEREAEETAIRRVKEMETKRREREKQLSQSVAGEVLRISSGGSGGQIAASEVKRLVAQRQDRELSDLVTKQYREKESSIKRANAEIDLIHENNLISLQEKYSDDPIELETAVKNLNVETETERQRKLMMLKMEIDDKQQQESVALKSSHLQQLASVFNYLSGNDPQAVIYQEGEGTSIAPKEGDATQRYVNAVKDDLEAEKARLDLFRLEREEETKKKLKEFEESMELQKKIAHDNLMAEQAELEQKMQQQANREEETARLRAEKIRERLLQEQMKLQQKKLLHLPKRTATGEAEKLTEEEVRGRIMNQFEKDREQLAAVADAERDRQTQSLKQRLQLKVEMRRKERERERQEFLERSARIAEQKKTLIDDEKHVALLEQGAVNAMSHPGGPQPTSQQSLAGTPAQPPPLHPLWQSVVSSSDTTDKTTNGGFGKRLDELERLLSERGDEVRGLVLSLKKTLAVLQQLQQIS
eukprot:GHVR01177126.1.p1 GENE.GHVR01177126.1~~GHVR01177126.1.p1  ORF type:complete len:899 (-),score=306.49 GHVR01177126.1:353-3049(-)